MDELDPENLNWDAWGQQSEKWRDDILHGQGYMRRERGAKYTSLEDGLLEELMRDFEPAPVARMPPRRSASSTLRGADQSASEEKVVPLARAFTRAPPVEPNFSRPPAKKVAHTSERLLRKKEHKGPEPIPGRKDTEPLSLNSEKYSNMMRRLYEQPLKNLLEKDEKIAAAAEKEQRERTMLKDKTGKARVVNTNRVIYRLYTNDMRMIAEKRQKAQAAAAAELKRSNKKLTTDELVQFVEKVNDQKKNDAARRQKLEEKYLKGDGVALGKSLRASELADLNARLYAQEKGHAEDRIRMLAEKYLSMPAPSPRRPKMAILDASTRLFQGQSTVSR
eukprot:NODE_1979_length_1338_cov_45.346005_g1796_i0.p1 GENE.NODE_1979_length_1338_cov_45.346005_g1796_i0~~NODE_1979_length_1338_cov_45.346005_g1796_i0.p1  ORF type:complete len:335 (-),score=70.49 NODE_1979_length_1338_cov_45.346005_g1796_i0:207-1211(-)